MITLHFDKLYNRPRNNEPCMISIPFKKGILFDTKEFSILQDNKQMPCQTSITGWYPDHSIKYLFVRFLANLPANDSTSLTCCLTKEELTAASICSEKTAAFPRISMTETEQQIQIATGPLSFCVQNHTTSLFSSLQNNHTVYHADQFCGPTLTDSSSHSFSMNYHTWSVLEAGPVCTVLSCDAFLTSTQTQPDTYPCQVKLTCYAGQSYLDVALILTNATEQALEISSYQFHYCSQQNDLQKARTCVASSNYRTHYLTSETGETVSENITAQSLFYQNMEHFAEVFAGTFFADHTTKEQGICGTIYQASQNFPKAVISEQSGFTLCLVPENDEPVIMQSGMAREQRFQLFFHAPDLPLEEINHRSTVYQMPDMPYLDSQVYEDSELFPDIFVHQKSFEAETALIQCGDNHARAFGMMNWGDAPDQNYTSQGRGDGKLVWTNNEYDFPHACMLQYFKTGLRRFLDYALVAGKHQIDVDVCHFSSDPLLLGGQWEHTQGHVLQGDMVCSHQWVEGILDCYHATADIRFYHTALGIGENILALLDTPMYQQEASFSARETGWALRTLTALYVETNDAKWTIKSKWIVSQFKDWATHYGGWLAPYMDNVSIRVPFMISVAVGSLMRYYRAFPSEEIRSMILFAVDDMLSHCILENGLFYYKELPSLNRLGNNPLVLEALAIAFELTGDQKYLQAGMKTYQVTIERMLSAGNSGRKIVEDAVILGSAGTKGFAQSFLPVATFYKALEKI